MTEHSDLDISLDISVDYTLFRNQQLRAEEAEAKAMEWEEAYHKEQQKYLQEVEARKAVETELEKLKEVQKSREIAFTTRYGIVYYE